MQIKIKSLTGRVMDINVENDETILALKQNLQEKEGIAVDQIRLIYNGKQLVDDKTLESYKIEAGKTIHMILTLRGGM
jgi:ubiquitin-like protein Nedd8